MLYAECCYDECHCATSFVLMSVTCWVSLCWMSWYRRLCRKILLRTKKSFLEHQWTKKKVLYQRPQISFNLEPLTDTLQTLNLRGNMLDSLPMQFRGRNFARCQCYNTFYVRNLRIFIISQSVCHWKAFPIMSNACELWQEPSLEWSTWKMLHSGSLIHKH